jgi:hypothetical protein
MPRALTFELPAAATYVTRELIDRCTAASRAGE